MLALLALCAAQSFGLDQDVELPTLGDNFSDHATVAINRYGDVVVANHADFAGASRLVEATVLKKTGPATWQRVSPILLGDPDRDVYGDDICHKPDVAALGDGSFVVVWPRFSRSDGSRARLECARILTRDAQGLLLASPIVDSRRGGEGWTMDQNLDSGVAGVMPDVCAVDGTSGGCYAVYAHEESESSGVAGMIRNYAVRAMELDWEQQPNSQDWKEGPWLLGSGIGTDNRYADPPRGGLVLPDVLVDDHGDVVVAWEEFWLAEHPGWSGGERGQIRIRRYEKPVNGAPGDLMDEIVRSGTQQGRPQRRPMMSASRDDVANTVLLAWNEDLAGSAADQLLYESYVFSSNGAPGYAGPSPAYWESDVIHQEALPRPLQTSRTSICLAARALGSARVIYAGYQQTMPSLELMIPVPAAENYAQRPAVAVLEEPNGGGPLVQTMVLTYEGAQVQDPDQYRIHVLLTRK